MADTAGNRESLELLAAITDTVLAVNREWQITYINFSGTAPVGLSPEEVIGRNLWEVFPGLVGSSAESQCRSVMGGRKPARFVSKSPARDLWFLTRVFPIENGILIVSVNDNERLKSEIQNQKLLEENLRHKDLLDAIFASAPAALAVLVGEELCFAFANPAYRYLTPNPFKDPAGCAYEEVWREKNPYDNLRQFRKVLATGQPFQLPSVEISYPDESRRVFNLQARRIDWGGEAAVLVILWDITERNDAEQQLVATALFPEQNPHPILRLDRKGRILYANPASQELLPEYRQGGPVSEFLQGIARDALESGEGCVVDFEHRDRVYTVHVIPIPEAGYVNLYLGDITERKAAEEKLADQADLFETVQDAIVATDARLIITSWNQAAEELYGWKREEAIGRNAIQLFQSEASPQQRATALEQAVEAGISVGETVHRARDGRRMNVEYHVKARKGPNRTVTGYIFSNRDATARRLTEGFNAALNEIHQVLLSTRATVEILQAALSRGAQAVGCETAALSLRQGSRWRIGYVHGFPREVVGTFMDDRQERHAVLAIQTGQPVAIDDAYHDPRVNRNHMRKWGVRSGLVIPLHMKEQVIGVIFFNFHQKVFGFQQAHLDFGVKLAAAISMALENADLIETLEQEIHAGNLLAAELGRTAKEYRDLVHLAPTGIYEMDFQGKRFLSVNEALCRFSGYSREELLAMDPSSLLDEDSRIRFHKRIEEWLGGEVPDRNTEYRVRLKDGRMVDALLNATFKIDEEGKPAGATVVITDITAQKQAERALREAMKLAEESQKAAEASEIRYRLLAEQSPDGILVSVENRFVYANLAAAGLVRASDPKDLIGLSPFDVLEPGYHAEIRERMERILARPGTTPFKEECWRRFDGTPVDVEVSLLAIRWDGMAAIQVVARDITARKERESALRDALQAVSQSEELRRLALTAGQTGAWSWDLRSNRLQWSDEYYRIFGLEPGSLEPSPEDGFSRVHPDDRARVEASVREAIAKGAAMDITHRVIWQDGSIHWVRGLSQMFFDEQGRPARMAGLTIDITPQKQAEQALRDSQDQLAGDLADALQLQKISTQLVQQDRVDRLYGQLVQAAMTLLGSDMGSLQVLDREKNALHLVAWKGFAPASARFWHWVRASDTTSCGVALDQKKRMIVPDTEAWELAAGTRDLAEYRRSGIRSMQSTPLISRAGEVVGVISTHWREPYRPTERELRLLDVLARQAADLVERSQAAAALRESEERFRLLADSSPTLIWVTGETGENLFVNRNYCTYFGMAPEQVTGTQWQPIVHPDDRAGYVAAFLQAVRAQAPFQGEMRARRADGAWRWLNTTAQPRFSATGRFLGHIGSSIDIHERKAAEQALRESEERYRAALANAPIAVFTLDENLRYTWVHHPLMGLDAGQMLGKRDEDLDSYPNIGELTALEQKVLATGRGVQQEFIARRERPQHILLNLQPQFGDGGQVVGLTGSAMDITSLRELEKNQAEYQTNLEVHHRLLEQREQERLQIARDLHDGPVQEILGAVYALNGIIRGGEAANVSPELAAIAETLQRQVAELRDYAGELRPPALSKFGLEKAIRSHAETFQQKYPEVQVAIQASQAGGLLPEALRLAFFRIYQEAMNNIARHCPNARVEVTFRKDGREAWLQVADSGPGFDVPEDWLALARAGHLGLLGMRERAEALQGRLEIDSKPGRGTRIRITVPLPRSP